MNVASEGSEDDSRTPDIEPPFSVLTSEYPPLLDLGVL
jgi:hypothetical protein